MTGSHEFGHTFNLRHDGDTSQTGSSGVYYAGHGTGVTSWGPIMGAPFTASVVQWSKGQYLNANNTEDDVATISGSFFGLGYTVDDYASSTALAQNIPQLTKGTISAAGVIETLVESGAKSQSDKRFATSWSNLIADIEKAAKVADAHGAKPANLTDAEWAMVLSFAAYGQSLDTSMVVGTQVHADVFRYPGGFSASLTTNYVLNSNLIRIAFLWRGHNPTGLINYRFIVDGEYTGGTGAVVQLRENGVLIATITLAAVNSIQDALATITAGTQDYTIQVQTGIGSTATTDRNRG